ncbi:MAG: YicC family protein [Paludibacteraceae bacterium]|nr:YicC family protein [Paludibacteraceae bacterium]
MIQSMTGYGKAEYAYADHKTIVEIRSLNSKQLDLTLKVAPLFRDKEADIRSLITAAVERGKIDVLIYTTSLTGENGQPALTPINKDAFRYYYNEVRSLQAELGINEADITAAVLRIPDVIKVQQDAELSDDEWAMLQSAVSEALNAFVAFRTQEGAALEAMFRDKLNGIEALLAEVEPYEKSRVAKIKARLLANLEQLSEQTKQAVDQNRLEAELIYYLEKLDITEEKVRLTNHIKYFRETLAEQGAGVGKKLGFVAQEMGREINTLGSKSNQSEMQIIVVKMKDILEQIKEQVLNVL